METNYNSWRVFGGGFWTFVKVLYFEDVSANERERTLTKGFLYSTSGISQSVTKQRMAILIICLEYVIT